MSADYYAVLGVDPSANEDEIKRAFRALARQYHPDANPDDPNATERFKEISEAYETLRDPERRRRYDMFGPEGAGAGAGGGSPFGAGAVRLERPVRRVLRWRRRVRRFAGPGRTDARARRRDGARPHTRRRRRWAATRRSTCGCRSSARRAPDPAARRARIPNSAGTATAPARCVRSAGRSSASS